MAPMVSAMPAAMPGVMGSPNASTPITAATTGSAVQMMDARLGSQPVSA